MSVNVKAVAHPIRAKAFLPDSHPLTDKVHVKSVDFINGPGSLTKPNSAQSFTEKLRNRSGNSGLRNDIYRVCDMVRDFSFHESTSSDSSSSSEDDSGSFRSSSSSSSVSHDSAQLNCVDRGKYHSPKIKVFTRKRDDSTTPYSKKSTRSFQKVPSKNSDLPMEVSSSNSTTDNSVLPSFMSVFSKENSNSYDCCSSMEIDAQDLHSGGSTGKPMEVNTPSISRNYRKASNEFTKVSRSFIKEFKYFIFNELLENGAILSEINTFKSCILVIKKFIYGELVYLAAKETNHEIKLLKNMYFQCFKNAILEMFLRVIVTIALPVIKIIEREAMEDVDRPAVIMQIKRRRAYLKSLKCVTDKHCSENVSNHVRDLNKTLFNIEPCHKQSSNETVYLIRYFLYNSFNCFIRKLPHHSIFVAEAHSVFF